MPSAHAHTQLPSHPGDRVPTGYSRAPARPPPGMVVSPLNPCSPSGETAALISGPCVVRPSDSGP